jgi:hypothetical protein
MKKLLFLLPALLLWSSLRAQPLPKDFNVKDFNRKFAIAKWLNDYETVNWVALDYLSRQEQSRLSDIGRDWFCYQDRDSLWHAVYGHFDGRRYEVLFFLRIDTTFSVTEDKDLPSQTFLLPYARALETAYVRLLRDHRGLQADLTHYIRKNENGTFTIWFFPSMLQKGMAVYGGEFSYLIDAAGQKILSSSGYFTGKFKGFPVENGPEEITLDYSDVDQPTLGGILFVWEYKEFFHKIKLETARNISSVLKDHTGEYYWIHVEK